MQSQLPARADRATRHVSVLVFIAGFLALVFELTSDHRAWGPSPISTAAVEAR